MPIRPDIRFLSERVHMCTCKCACMNLQPGQGWAAILEPSVTAYSTFICGDDINNTMLNTMIHKSSSPHGDKLGVVIKSCTE